MNREKDISRLEFLKTGGRYFLLGGLAVLSGLTINKNIRPAGNCPGGSLNPGLEECGKCRVICRWRQ